MGRSYFVDCLTAARRLDRNVGAVVAFSFPFPAPPAPVVVPVPVPLPTAVDCPAVVVALVEPAAPVLALVDEAAAVPGAAPWPAKAGTLPRSSVDANPGTRI